MKYQKPQAVAMEKTAEGIFLASGSVSGSDCSYGDATITFNEKDYRGDKYRITVKAPHNGKVNDRRGQKTVLTFTVPVRNVTVEGDHGQVDGANSGTTITITADESHHSEYNLQVVFEADSKPDVTAVVTPN